MWKAAVYHFFPSFNGDFERGLFAFQVMNFLTDLPQENMIGFKGFSFNVLVSSLLFTRTGSLYPGSEPSGSSHFLVCLRVFLDLYVRMPFQGRVTYVWNVVSWFM